MEIEKRPYQKFTFNPSVEADIKKKKKYVFGLLLEGCLTYQAKFLENKPKHFTFRTIQ